MGDVAPSLYDLIAPIIEEIVAIEWDNPQVYDPTAQKVGRYRGAYVLSVYDDWVRIRTTFQRLNAADPDFLEKLKKFATHAKLDIDTFEYGTHGKIPRQ